MNRILTKRYKYGTPGGWLLVWTLSLLLCPGAYAQTDSLKSLLRQFDRYRHQALQEKLFLHLDRPLYAAGETMWFKVYAADGSFNKPLDLSRVAYVEVLNAEQQPVLQGKIGLADGTGQGSFLLRHKAEAGLFIFGQPDEGFGICIIVAFTAGTQPEQQRKKQ